MTVTDRSATALLGFVLAVVPASALAAPPTDAELEACLGKTDAGIPAFGKLKRDMTPKQAAAAWPGADKLDDFGFATLAPKGCKGATTFKLHFIKGTDGARTLQRVQIELDPALTQDEAFYKRLVARLVGKYGPPAVENAAKKVITWDAKGGYVSLSTFGTMRLPLVLRVNAPLP